MIHVDVFGQHLHFIHKHNLLFILNNIDESDSVGVVSALHRQHLPMGKLSLHRSRVVEDAAIKLDSCRLLNQSMYRPCLLPVRKTNNYSIILFQLHVCV